MLSTIHYIMCLYGGNRSVYPERTGEYVKWNSNSGFVEADKHVARRTPHAFSHYTFERTSSRRHLVSVAAVLSVFPLRAAALTAKSSCDRVSS